MNTFTDAITQGQENLTRTQQTLNTLMTKLSDSIELLNKIASDPEYDFVNEILGSDPQTLRPKRFMKFQLTVLPFHRFTRSFPSGSAV